ncbi:hypothetical protein V1264_019260 [Littorina saxatilis]|uniref:Protein kinase domain-containing protein n=1 Tax=Littorina saxatilis TaxID=31220 RepID=A0AAN9BEZ0_9CAEN
METESGRSGQFTNEQGQFLLACSTVLFDRYRVLKIIHHRGQSATIILAKDTQRDRQVVIKALHAHSVWFNIGLQEARILRQLANADPHKFSRTARLLDVFVYDSHICLVFDALNPKPITQVFKGSSYTHEEKLKNLRKMTLQLLQVAGFLRQNHVIHADLKPENILFKDVTDLNTMKVVDFGNAIRLRSEELALYHEHFEVQSPLYRAPEVKG